ncbi:MAG: NAD(P)-dependent oxidoreductase, partial [Candidatus Thorarchaeota archaeon]
LISCTPDTFVAFKNLKVENIDQTLNEANSNIQLHERELELLGENGLLVTVARGEVINEKDFYEVLRDKKIAGAAIDVWYNYRPEPDELGRKFPSNYPFYELDNVILSPHRGASPMSDLRRWNEVIENINRFSLGESKFLNEVDLELEY